MSIEVSGILGLLVLIADIWAILNIVQSSVSTGKKLVWILVILLLPVLGLIIWWLAGPREASAT
ncbi:MAG: PLDc N-terminal domain-containing protein [Pseudomonadales bacterium]